MVNGIVLVDKPEGVTSHDVVGALRKLFSTRKVGHAGTLDPMATGVLVLGINAATRMLGHLTLSTKAYEAVIRIGAESTTDDREGVLSSVKDTDWISDERIQQVCSNYRGGINQVPSSVSAIKVSGRRAHEIVRTGGEVTLDAREVTIDSFVINSIHRSGPWTDVAITVHCSAGTYIRALARDIGRDLGVGGHLTQLRRTAVGPFHVDSCVSLPNLLDSPDPGSYVTPMGVIAERVWPCVTVDQATREKVAHGQRLTSTTVPDVSVFGVLGADHELLAIASNLDSHMKYKTVFVGIS